MYFFKLKDFFSFLYFFFCKGDFSFKLIKCFLGYVYAMVKD